MQVFDEVTQRAKRRLHEALWKNVAPPLNLYVTHEEKAAIERYRTDEGQTEFCGFRLVTVPSAYER